MNTKSMLKAIYLIFFILLTWAGIATFHPSKEDNVSYSITVFDGAASSKPGPVLFQIQASTALQWAALGQGTQMAGANMFIVYASSSSGNVTVTPRSAAGHIQPEYNPGANTSLLAGTGIQNKTMTANIKCHSCLAWDGGHMDPDTSSSKWIWAYKKGPPLKSDNMSEEIDFHDNFGSVVVDLTKAQAASSDGNPFLTYDSNAVSNNAVSLAGKDFTGDHSNKMMIAHALLMAIAFILLFPVFALLVSCPVPFSVPKAHAPLQGFALAVTIAGTGLGIKLWVATDTTKDAHPIIGIVTVAILILLQPAMGWIQHLYFRRTGGKSLFSHIHRWLGRCMIILGTINGGLGFRFAGVGNPGSPRSAVIAYSVIAGFVFLVYVAVQVVSTAKGKQKEHRQGIRDEQNTGSGGLLESSNVPKQDSHG